MNTRESLHALSAGCVGVPASASASASAGSDSGSCTCLSRARDDCACIADSTDARLERALARTPATRQEREASMGHGNDQRARAA
eukprot:641655-Pleurochrysis_carterae.AAC.1